MASSCSIDGCKRAITCLCHHCNRDVCSKHFNEHQSEVNNELIPITDRLNDLKMRLRMNNNNDQTSPLGMLQIWKQKKYQEIDDEYNRKVDELKEKIAKHDEQITQTIANVRDVLNEGDVSIDQVKYFQKTIENLTNQVNQLFIKEIDFQGKTILIGGYRYHVKAKINCNNKDLYALESERALTGYDGLCPQCGVAHVLLKPNRGMYALCKTIDEILKNL